METILTSPYICAAVVIIFFLILFKKQIANLLERTKSISKKGLETGIIEKQIQQDADKTTSKNIFSGDFLLNHIVEKQYPFISKGVKEIKDGINEMNIENSKKEDVLLKFLALSVAARRAEITYREIFGTQITLLQYLNTKNKNGEEINNLLPFYEQFLEKSNIKKEHYTFDNYIGWLSYKRLIFVKDNKIFISDEGIYFLTYLLENKYISNKAF